ncbi:MULTISPECIES: DUF2730 family protein [unclassified Xanthobacter]|uniref:DUF2730 family protein n=1 Tax=unclassified Xanthobacter TaxID=2623496 RepID=UPI001EE06E4B|nr:MULTISPECIES: DUF2730 family protein [unclassified Xanthobacter]
MVYGWLLWAAKKGLASQDDVRAEAAARAKDIKRLEDDVGGKIGEIDRRTLRIEADLEHLPTAKDMADLRQEVARIAGSMEGSQRELTSISRALTRVEDRLIKGDAA